MSYVLKKGNQNNRVRHLIIIVRFRLWKENLRISTTDIFPDIDWLRFCSALNFAKVRIANCEEMWTLSTDAVLCHVRQALGHDCAEQVADVDEKDVDGERRNRESAPDDGSFLRQHFSSDHFDDGDCEERKGEPDNVQRRSLNGRRQVRVSEVFIVAEKSSDRRVPEQVK